MGKLSTETRDDMKGSEFAIPSKRAYPIPDQAHARMALAMVARYGSPEEKAKVRAAVKKRYPGMTVTD